jgi:hypothetical protein
MPDSRDFSRQEPLDWSGAFLALPMESPPADGWAVVSRSLASRTSPPSLVGRRERRINWLIWTVSAAVLAVVAWAPLERWLDASQDADAARLTAATSPARGESDAVGLAKDSADRPARTGRIESGAPGAPVSTPVATKGSATSLPSVSDATPRRPKHSRAQPGSSSRGTSSAVAAATPDVLQPSIDVPSATDAAVVATADPLPRLYAESAQLEALVALARDDRVASASGAVLTGELDARIGLIDAALSQSNLSPMQRSGLWQQRVDALRELAGVESTERWLAAHGERLDGALVRVD